MGTSSSRSDTLQRVLGRNAGVHALARNLAIELASDNIRVNAVAPAVVETPIYSSFLGVEAPKVLQTFDAFMRSAGLANQGMLQRRSCPRVG